MRHVARALHDHRAGAHEPPPSSAPTPGRPLSVDESREGAFFGPYHSRGVGGTTNTPRFQAFGGSKILSAKSSSGASHPNNFLLIIFALLASAKGGGGGGGANVLNGPWGGWPIGMLLPNIVN